jgi:hypothetical protein
VKREGPQQPAAISRNEAAMGRSRPGCGAHRCLGAFPVLFTGLGACEAGPVFDIDVLVALPGPASRHASSG